MSEELRQKIAAMTTGQILRAMRLLRFLPASLADTDDVRLMREELERRGVELPTPGRPWLASPRAWIIFGALVLAAWLLWAKLR